ncbi:MAG: lysophospholipid transporter LplT [Thiobacillus sp.]
MLSPAQRRRAFFAVISAQFFSSLADNALLIASIGLLVERHAAAWTAPTLRLLFYLAYVLMAVVAGAVADAFPKGRVIWASNLVKLGGCGLLLAHIHPLLAYTLIGTGAAAYAPAKYDILPELLADEALVAANAWMEISTVFSILLGVILASVLLEPESVLLQLASTPAARAVVLIASIYLIAAVCAAFIPAGVGSKPETVMQASLLRNFVDAIRVLWRDPEGQISLAVTSLFWAVAAVLQFVTLRWAEQIFHLGLAQAALLQIAVALGMVAGAVMAARWVRLHQALSMLPIGIAIGITLMLLSFVNYLALAIGLFLVTGLLSGLMLIPMNALLQQRGHVLMLPGQSIAVQNFNESLASLILLGIYGGLLYLNVPLLSTLVGFGIGVSAMMLFIMRCHKRNILRSESEAVNQSDLHDKF